MRVGIVGNEASKFTRSGESVAKTMIRVLLKNATEVVSGGCHLGGVDAWAAEIGKEMGITVTEFLPRTLSWTEGYKPRNLLIANRSDIVYCLAVRTLPEEYTGMVFPKCYHCNTTDHIKSGGCWTVKQALRLGKVGSCVLPVLNLDI